MPVHKRLHFKTTSDLQLAWRIPKDWCDGDWTYASGMTVSDYTHAHCRVPNWNAEGAKDETGFTSTDESVLNSYHYGGG